MSTKARASRLETLASWSRRDRSTGTLRVQIHASGAWRNVLPIAPEQEAQYIAVLGQLTELLPQARWRIARPDSADHILIGGDA